MSKIFTYKLQLATFVAAVIISLTLFQYSSIMTTSPCEVTPGCPQDKVGDMPGKLVHRQQGFPLPYYETLTYYADDPASAGFAEATAPIEQPAVRIAPMLVNIVFWYALIDFLFRVVRHFRVGKVAKAKRR